MSHCIAERLNDKCSASLQSVLGYATNTIWSKNSSTSASFTCLLCIIYRNIHGV